MIDKIAYFRHHEFIETIAQKMLKGTHRELTDFGKTRYGFENNAAVEYLLYWDDPDSVALDELIDEMESKSLYSQMLEKRDEQDEAGPSKDSGEDIPF